MKFWDRGLSGTLATETSFEREEYQQSPPAGYHYSQFCELYRRWRQKKLDVVLGQDYRAGEKISWTGLVPPFPSTIAKVARPRRPRSLWPHAEPVPTGLAMLSAGCSTLPWET